MGSKRGGLGFRFHRVWSSKSADTFRDERCRKRVPKSIRDEIPSLDHTEACVGVVGCRFGDIAARVSNMFVRLCPFTVFAVCCCGSWFLAGPMLLRSADSKVGM